MSELGIGSKVAGYRIEDVLGRGGMGVVYRADDDRLGRSAAVKVIAPEQAGDAAFRRRFIEESRAAAAIDHPNVLPVYEAGEEDGVLFLVTRMVEGADLAELLEREGPLALDRALALTAQVGAALDAAHARGLIHRDVKPGNVLVARDPGPGTEHCYLTDFGLAQQDDRRSRLTTTGQFVGTLDYIAPEQIQGGDRRRARRPLRPGGAVLRVRHRGAAVRARLAAGAALRPPQRPASADLREAGGGARGAQRRDRQGDGEGAGGPLRQLHRVRRGGPRGARRYSAGSHHRGRGWRSTAACGRDGGGGRGGR